MALVTVAVCVPWALNERDLQRPASDRISISQTPERVMEVYKAVNLPAIGLAFLPFTRRTNIDVNWDSWLGMLVVGLLALWLVAVTVGIWFCVGRWIDRQLGWLPASTWRGSWASVIGAGIGIGMATVFISMFGSLGVAGWAGFATFAMGMHIRRVLPGLRKGYSS